jgi:chitodextrinase
VGQFANGDWWVVGPVTINSISPGWDGTKNGTMFNPVSSGNSHGFDTRVPHTNYSASLNKADDLPLTVPVNTSVVSTSGLSAPNSKGLVITQVAVLTVLGSAPASDAFRPPYSGTNKTILGEVSDLDYSVFLNLPPVNNTPSKAAIEDKLGVPIIDFINQWQNTSLKAASSSHYGREIAYKSADAALWLNLNHTEAEKESVLIDVVQRGIDVYGLAKYGNQVWWPNGGHNLGRKIYLAIAANVLDHSDMKDWVDADEHLVFQEDSQHFYVTQNDVDTARGNDNFETPEPYTSAMIGMPEWSSNPLTERNKAGSQWGRRYRNVNGGPNVGIALAANLMGLRSQWNREVFFEYIDDRAWPNYEAQRQNAPNKIHLFHADMWEAYRYVNDSSDTTPPSTPTGLSSSDVSPYTIDISWSASTDNEAVIGYYIYLDGVKLFPQAGTTATLTGLSPDTSYSIRVSAYDAGGNESNQSTVLNITTDASAVEVITSVTASDHDGNLPSNTIDGNLSTRWSANGSGEWIQYQLDDAYVIEEMAIAFFNGDSRVSYFEIQTSSNGSTWTTVYASGASSGTSLGLESFDLTDTTAQFVRYVGGGNSVNGWNSITEIQLTIVGLSSDTTAPSTPSGLTSSSVASTSFDLDWTASSDNVGVAGYFIYLDGENIATVDTNSVTITELNPQTQYSVALVAFDDAGNESALSSAISVTTTALGSGIVSSVSASDHDGNVPANTIDGDLTTRWSAEGSGEWIQYNLDDSYLLDRICIAFYNGASRVATFDVDVSSDGSAWTTILDGVESGGTTTGFESFDFTDVNASYVRIVGYGNSDNDWNSLNEVEFTIATTSSDTTAPSVPSGLVTDATTQSSISISWSASSDDTAVTGYNIYVDSSFTQSVSGASTTLMGLASGTSYSIKVSAYDAAGNESAQSSALSASTTSGTPSSYSVTGSTADAGVRDTGAIDWLGESEVRVGGASSSDDRAAVFVFALPALSSGESVTSASLSFNYAGKSNTPDGNIDLYGIPHRGSSSVVAADYYEGAYAGDTTAATLQDNIITVGTPTGSVTTDLGGGDNLVDYLNAQYAAGAGSGDFIFIRLNSDVIDESSYRYYRVETANSSNPPVLTFDTNTAAADAQAPTVPSSLAASNVTATTVDLSWSASSDNVGVTAYRIYQDSVYLQSVTGTTATVTGLSQSTGYSFTVTAMDAANNESSTSSAVSVTTADGEAPTIPTGLDSSNVTASTVDLSWNASTDNVSVTGYKVYVNGANPISVSGTSTTIDSLTSNTTYSFSVTALDSAANESLYSDEEIVTTSSVVVSTYTVGGASEDRGLSDNGSTDWIYESNCRVGGASGSNDRAMVFVFVLPTLAAGEVITDADLSFNLESIANTPNGNADLYGLPYQTSLSIGSSQYYDGTFDGDAGAEGIEGAILTPSSTSGAISTSSTGDANLVDYLNAQYDAGAEGGDYVLIRLNSSVSNEGNYKYYTVSTANSGNGPSLWIETEK